MSWNPALDPHCPLGDGVDAIDTLIIPRARDLGGFEVRRALPAPKRQMVGPFIFFNVLRHQGTGDITTQLIRVYRWTLKIPNEQRAFLTDPCHCPVTCPRKSG